MHESIEAWSDFNVAMAGATAALAGLIIVAMSVNIERVVAARSVSARAISSIGALVLAVVAACVGLAPEQPLWALGGEIFVGSLVVLLLSVNAARAIYADTEIGYLRSVRSGVGLIAPIAFTIGSIVLLTDRAWGYYWIAGASVAAIIAGLVFSWVALVEILR